MLRPAEAAALGGFTDATPTRPVGYTASHAILTDMARRASPSGRPIGAGKHWRSPTTCASGPGAAQGRLKCGRASITALIADHPQYLASARMAELLSASGLRTSQGGAPPGALPGEPGQSVGGLSDRQRDRLIGVLEE